MSRVFSKDINKHINKEVTLLGWVHKLRKLGGISFLVLRDKEGLAQAVIEKASENVKLQDLATETVIKISGKVIAEERAPHGAEIRVTKLEIISAVREDIPIAINKKEMNVNLDTLLDNRPITLRSPKQRAIFKVQAEIMAEFRSYLTENGFVEYDSPKIVSSGVETGGAEMFTVDYFKKKAYLSQSPQMYKQIMVGVFERVFETSHMFRAEKHNTSRHLNEYMSMDFEMGFIDSYEDIMNMEEGYIKSMITRLEKNCSKEFELLGAKLPKIPKKIPRLKLSEVQNILEKEYKEKCSGAPDLEPKHEKQICEFVEKKFDSEFIFVTHYPTKKRPFYTHEDPQDPEHTLSFDLLFRGLEMTTGGQRLHLYDDYIKRMRERKMDPAGFEDYLSIFRYGMPPHGGLAIGMERLTSLLLGLENVREGCLFPRDINRLRP